MALCDVTVFKIELRRICRQIISEWNNNVGLSLAQLFFFFIGNQIWNGREIQRGQVAASHALS